MEDENLNLVEAQMRIGAKIQRFYDILREYRADFENWKAESEEEVDEKKAREEMIFSLLDEYLLLFENILAR